MRPELKVNERPLGLGVYKYAMPLRWQAPAGSAYMGVNPESLKTINSKSQTTLNS